MANSENFDSFESSAIKVGALLDSFNVTYRIPLLQRKYVWEDDQIRQLLQDVEESFSVSEPYYFIGGMVFARGNDERLIVIDGQQRLITIMLLLAAARDYFLETSNPKLANYYAKHISDDSLDPETGDTLQTYKLQLYGADDEVFRSLLQGKKWTKDSGTVSEKNLLASMEVITEYVQEILNLQKYMAYLLNNVYLVKTVASSQSTAFTIFETLNHRGAKLQPEDLLKNLLLQSMNDRDFDAFGNKWQSFIEKLMDRGRYTISISSFLRHHIMSSGQRITKSSIYKWFQDKEIDTRDKAYEILHELDRSATMYRKYLAGKDSRSLAALHELRFRQGYVVLLACLDLPFDLQNEVTVLLETIAFSYVITGTKTNKLEDRFCDVASLARKAVDNPLAASELLNQLRAIAAELKDAVVTALFRFRCRNRGDKAKALYILGKLAGSLDGADYSNYTLEHIAPQSLNLVGREYDDFILALGNLTLLAKSDNAAANDKPFYEKRAIYANQSGRLTRSIVTMLETGTKNTKFDKSAAIFDYVPVSESDEWNEVEVRRRTSSMVNLAKYVWFDELGI